MGISPLRVLRPLARRAETIPLRALCLTCRTLRFENSSAQQVQIALIPESNVLVFGLNSSSGNPKTLDIFDRYVKDHLNPGWHHYVLSI
jgi:hypothetical protein